jgi:hypothetical protein
MLPIKDRVNNLLPDWFELIRRHWKFHGAFPNFIRPVTFTEKLLHRMLFDRRAVLTQMADKAAVRDYVESRLGPHMLPKLYYLTNQPETIPFDELPERFVVKPTHASGWVQIVTDKPALDRAALIEKCTGWLNQSYYKINREWEYKNIPPRIIVEEFIDDGSRAAPNDYKLSVFGGTVEFIEVHAGRFTDHRVQNYTPAWQKLDVIVEGEAILSDVLPPVHLADMIAAAETLGKDLDFVRVDFYDTPARLYFGELTTTPAAGFLLFRPTEFDRYLGGRWK